MTDEIKETVSQGSKNLNDFLWKKKHADMMGHRRAGVPPTLISLATSV